LHEASLGPSLPPTSFSPLVSNALSIS